MRILLIELLVIAGGFLVLRLLRSKIQFFRGGYILRRDSFAQNESMRVFVEDTHFFRKKQGTFRSMRVEGSNLVYSRIPLDENNKALMVYPYCAPLLKMLKGYGTSIRRTLTLGGGGGAVPLHILQNYDGSTADIVEFNADSIRMMQQYFLTEYIGGESPRAKLIHADARDAVGTLDAPYQFIFCDLYVGGQPDELIYDMPFMQQVSRLAGETGMLVINGGSLNLRGVCVVLRTLLQTFTHAWALSMGMAGFVLVAANREMPAMENLMFGAGGIIPIYPSPITKESLLADPE